MAHTKTGASIKGSRNSIAKRLGIKKYGGEKVISGNILVRQRGGTVKAGVGTYLSKDYTIIAKKPGIVSFSKQFKQVIVNII